MIFTRSNYPIITWLEDPDSRLDYFQLENDPQDQCPLDLFNDFKQDGSVFPISYISPSLAKAIDEAKDDLLANVDLERFILEHGDELFGTLLLADGVQIVYDITRETVSSQSNWIEDDELVKGEPFTYEAELHFFLVFHKTDVIGWGDIEVSYQHPDSDLQKEILDPHYSPAIRGKIGKDWHDFIIAFSLFKQLNPVKTTVLDPEKSTGPLESAYTNNSKSSITIYGFN